MSDSVVVLDPMSSGSSVAVDVVGGTAHQYTKMEWGGSGTVNAVSAVNPLPVSGLNGTITNVGTIESVGQVHNAGTIQKILQLTEQEGAAHASGDQGIQMFGVGNEAGSAFAAVGQYTPFALSTTGKQYIETIVDGTIRIPAGTVSVNTPGTITSGTVSVNTPGTITSGSIAVTAGTVGTVGAVGQIHNAGTVADGTLAQVTTVSNLTNGSVKVTAGTVTLASPGTITSGTVSINAGTIGAGTINAGTINSGTINSGTINSGTINSGTINVGTISPIPSKMISVIGSVWGTSSGTAGTLIAAPTSGSAIYLNELSIANEGTTTLTAGIGFGTGQQGTTVLSRVAMAGNGGIQKSFPVATTGGGTQLPLVIWTTGSGTAAFTASYFIAL